VTLRTVRAALTIQRMQRGRAARRSLAQARSSSSSSSQPVSSSALASASDAAAPERSCQSGTAPAHPALEITAAATLVVSAVPLMQVDARVAQSPYRSSLDALDVKAQSPRDSANPLDNAMKRLGPEALGGAQRPRHGQYYI